MLGSPLFMYYLMKMPKIINLKRLCFKQRNIVIKVLLPINCDPRQVTLNFTSSSIKWKCYKD